MTGDEALRQRLKEIKAKLESEEVLSTRDIRDMWVILYQAVIFLIEWNVFSK